MISELLVICIITFIPVYTLNECCPNENVLFLSNKSCLNTPNGTEINLECPQRFPIDHEKKLSELGLKLLKNDTMTDESGKNYSYCRAKKGDNPEDDSPMYVICADIIDEDNTFDGKKLHIQAVLGLISTVFVILTIIVYIMVPSLLDLQGICIMHTLVALAAGYITLAIVQLKRDFDDTLCTLFAYLLYISFIYLFLWLVVLSFHIWRTTVQPNLENKTNKWKSIYHAFAIIGTILAIIIVVCGHYSPSEFWNDFRPGFGEVSCWFQSPKVIWIYFYGPIVVLLSLNVMFYTWTLISLWRQTQNRHYKVLRYRLKLSAKLCIIMGITWIFEIFTYILKEHAIYLGGKIVLFLLDLLNILQGVLIFLVLVVFRKRVRRALAAKSICNLRFPSSWKYLEDEEIESAEKRAEGTAVIFTGVTENETTELT